ncbi:hypothetical protein SUGI_0139200 [Cryptomeria japonica]|uniref:protein EXORDIUM-like 2 n=1 Tax=Cryptomeria japonica TaxID=3369 RepID=UPI002408C539|nr:protein EXORDIUM-like 2 [Cryptomeria japonica]GLJ10973.1 hypothetical protein SUGI_0139200 [Cryptomeria japonica]
MSGIIYKCLLGFLLIACQLAHESFASIDSSMFNHSSRLSELVPDTPLVLRYHGGPVLTSPESIKVYILWYGKFTPAQKAPLLDFFSSFHYNERSQPCMKKWWAILQGYKDSSNTSIAPNVRLAKQASDVSYSLGKSLKRSSMGSLIRSALVKKQFPINPRGIYMVLTADNVFVENFCMSSCGFHDSMKVSNRRKVVISWVGNSGVQCPGYCAWPFAYPGYGPPIPPLIPPNGDVGIDGMVVVVATILAGTASNPFGDGYHADPAFAPQEAATACSGIFGPGAYTSYPGKLLMDDKSKASYNAYGINGRTFLLPALWSPHTASCKTTLG